LIPIAALIVPCFNDLFVLCLLPWLLLCSELFLLF
jgi:hypothetical protein